MTENIAQAIREDRGLWGEMSDLAAEARRLDRSLDVVEKWMEAADASSGETGRLWHHAITMRDQIGEELSRVAFRMEVEGRRRDYGEGLEATAEAAALSDALLAAYCVLRDAPAELFGDGSPRARYELMGALMEAMDVANEAANEAARGVAERLEPENATA